MVEKELVPEEVVSYFWQQTALNDQMAVPTNYLNEFEGGVASYQHGNQAMFDQFTEVLAPNFQESIVDKSGLIIPAADSSRTRAFCEQFHDQRQQRPIVVIVPHPSIASPFVAARLLNLPFSDETASSMYSIVGPRPMTYDYATSLGQVSPFRLGTMLNNLLLTGTNTASTDDAPAVVRDWLDDTAMKMKENLDEIMEPNDQGDNNVLIVCPSGKIGEQGKTRVKEFYPRSYRFAAALGDRALFWPIGVFDRVLVDSANPSSPVYFNPDGMAQVVEQGDEDDVYTLHTKAIELSRSSLGTIRMQSRFEAAGQGIRRKVAGFRRK